MQLNVNFYIDYAGGMYTSLIFRPDIWMAETNVRLDPIGGEYTWYEYHPELNLWPSRK
jgi:hypothetical protein